MKKLYALLIFSIPALMVAQGGEGIVDITSSLTPDLSAYGEQTNYPGEGQYEIFLDTDNGVLDKPILLIDGFDPGDGRDISGLYELLNYEGPMGTENLADFVRAEGFDVVIFNSPIYTRAADGAVIDGGSDFIERNAFLLVDIINIINAQKVGNEELVIIGPSMGGLISRYALNYMEANNLDHETRLWLSFDAPHLGANVPLGLQHLLNYLAFGLGNGLNVVEIQPLIDGFIKSPAARQLLTDHFEAHLLSGSDVEFDPALLTPEAHPWKGIFDSSINAFNASGFPEDTRNVAIINGSGIGNPYFAIGETGTTVTPGFQTLNIQNLNVAPLTTANFDAFLTPATADGTSQISSILIQICLFGCSDIVNTSANAAAFSYTDGIDAAPGGLFDLSSLTDDITVEPGSLTETFLNSLLIDKFNFIPSVSGLALEITNDEINWYHDIDLGPGDPPGMASNNTTNNTPFVNYYLPDDNEAHVALNQANVTFALSEIIPETLGNNAFELFSVQLAKNPVKEMIKLINTGTLQDARITVSDMLGKQVLRVEADLSGETNIPVSLSKGMYVLTIEVQGISKRIKFVAN